MTLEIGIDGSLVSLAMSEAAAYGSNGPTILRRLLSRDEALAVAALLTTAAEHTRTEPTPLATLATTGTVMETP